MGKITTLLILLGLLLVEKVYTQDCTKPLVPNGSHVGDLNEGGAAAVICNNGYAHGGDPTAVCAGGVWTVLPTCSPKDCGQPNNIQNGFLEGETFYQGNAVVTCNEGYTGGGKATCGSAASWTNLPACNAIDCGNPNVDNGVSLGDTDYGGSPFISCLTGYIGGGTALTCQTDGSWDINVSCDPRDCGNPNIANADFSGDTFYTGTASITCHAGYDKGAGSLTCQNTGNWATPKITCDPKDCGTPTITNGQLSTASSTLYGETAVVECKAGYLGGGAVVCLDTGAWGTIPACNPRDCGTETITNGVMTGSTLYGELANVVCNTGYVGGGDAFCETNGNWRMPLPSCAPIDCGTPDIPNGKLEPGFDDTVYAGTSVAMCNAGYIGGGVIQCQADGTWTANPDPCTPLDCGSPTIDHADFSGDTFYTGTPVVTCHAGYNKAGTAVCQTDGTWQLPTCTAKDCGPLNVANGLFSGTTVYDGSPLISCNTGYDKVGTAKCEANGVWTAPTCDPKDCGDPGIANSQLIGDTVYNAAAFIQCNPGYSGGGTAECLALGIWNSANLPTCTPKDCGTPTVANGYLDGPSLYDADASIACDSGYEGGGVITCQTTATWATPLPTCEPIDCNQPTIPNGGLTLGSSTKYAGNAFVECDSGYELAGGGSNVATCLASGNWDTLPICDPKDCGPLTNPVHGTVSAPVTTYQNVATYTCDSLYQLNGTATLICEADGNWAPNPPTCDDIDCPALTAPTNGDISTNSVKVGTTVDVTCDPTYTMFGNDLFNCQTGGTWDVSETLIGTCRKDCPTLTAPDFGFISTTDVFEGTVVDVTCTTAYTLEGANQISCQPGGIWNPLTMPVCTEDCQPLTVPAHGSISTNVLSQGTVVVVTCDTGYTLFGATIIECLTTADWNNAEPTCELDCPKLSPPQNGFIDNYSLSKFTSVVFGCDSGYTLFGETTLTCQGDSTWDFPAPVCLENCPQLSNPYNGMIDNIDPRQGTVTNVFCFGGYTLFGAATLTCQNDASWNYPMPECRQNCPALIPPDNGAIDSTDVSQNTEVNVNCSDTYTLFGAELLTCQSDATWDYAMPVCKLDCLPLAAPDNGYINNTVIRSQGTVVGVICFNLYTLFGESILTCQDDATWDYVEPECYRDCPILVPPAHGSINTTIESQFTVVGVECDTDYSLFGDDILFCQTDATWDTTLPVCKRNCRALVEPTNGNMYFFDVRQETEVSFDCDFEYTLFGSEVLLCQSDATWNSTEPTCEKDCPPLDIPHGSISTTVVIKDTVVNITCDTDYTLEGEAQLTCITNGVWDYTVPQCTKDCQALIPPTNGYLAAANGGSVSVSQGSLVAAFCNENYTAFGDDGSLFGDTVITCQTDNQWDYNVPTCRINCPPQEIPSHAIFSTMETYEGIINVVSCVTGFTRFGNQNITCLPGGFWDKSLPTCRGDCKTLIIPDDGRLDTSDVKEGTIVTTTCNTGYTLIGLATVECLPGGKWNRYLPDCHRECGTLVTPANGMVSTGDGTTLGKKAAYACLTGYDLSHTNIRQCQADGSWSFTAPTCVKRDCGPLQLPSNGWVNYSNGATTYLEIATFSCDSGYILTGDRRRLCRKDYSWSHSSPTCVIKDCGSLSNPSHGSVKTNGGTTFGQVANYYCNVGYSLIGVASRTCNSDGRWGALVPICQINDCGNLTSPANGEVTFTSTVYNELAFYSCHSGFDRVGTSSRVCQKDATWSSTAPICQIKDCGTLSNPTRGSVAYPNGITTYQEVAVFACDPGYTLIGNENRTCGASGKWGGSSPTCQIKDCGPLSNPDFGTVNIASGTTYGKKANYFCNFGYTLNGVSQRLCAEDGLWSDTEPVCEINDCGNLTHPSNGVVTIIKTTYNEIASYSCYSGFILVGVSQRVCRHDKTWSDAAPICVIKDCGSPYIIEHGSVVTPLGTEFNDSAVYNCDSNFGLVGDDAVLCLASGYWDSPPFCSRDCGLPADLENGKYLLQTDTLTTAIATYSCDNGYNLVGEPDVECLLTGAWEAPPVCHIDPKPFGETCYVTEQCVTSRAECRSDGLGDTRCLCEEGGEIYDNTTDTCLAYCGWLTAPTNGYIVLPSVPSENQIVTYTCDIGFALDNVTFGVRTCLATRQWSGRAPLCVTGCPTPTAPAHGDFDTPEGKAVGKFVYYTCDSTYSLVGEDYRECLADTTWNGNTPLCLKDCSILGNIDNGVVDLSDGHWEDSVATYYCDKDYALVGTATRTCEGDSGWSGTEPECIYAIFPDVLLVIACLLIFLVIVDIFIVLVCIYMRYKKKKDNEKPDGIMFDDLDDPNAEGKHPRGGHPGNKTGIPPLNFAHLGPGRSSFRKPERMQQVALEEDANKQIPQIPRKQKKSMLHRIPKPKPLRKLKRPKFFTSDTPMAPHPTPRTIPNSVMDEFADEKIAEMEKYLKDDFGTPSSSDANRRSTADEEKVSIEQVPTSRLPTGDKMVLMDFDDAQAGDLPTTRLEEPSTSGRDTGKDRQVPRERKKLQISADPPDVLRPHTPMFTQQLTSDV